MPDEPIPAVGDQRVLQAAAYIKGVFAGLVTDRTFAWKNRLRSSWLAETHVYSLATKLLRGEKLNSPIDCYDIVTAAEQLGFDAPEFRTQELIAIAMKTSTGPEFKPSRARFPRA